MILQILACEHRIVPLVLNRRMQFCSTIRLESYYEFSDSPRGIRFIGRKRKKGNFCTQVRKHMLDSLGLVVQEVR